jgi:pimeloyl-ACP methyl ester carboxylesterase
MFHFEDSGGVGPPGSSPQSARERWIDVRPEEGGLNLHVWEWAGAGPPFVLLHGLASNARTWDGVAAGLAAAGRRVIAVDQRGHGLSDKPAHGYGFSSVTGDLARLLDILALEAPILVGQSWGGNVVLAFAADYPGRARHLVFVDGGFLDLQMRPDAAWEHVARDLRPPDLTGFLRAALKKRIWAVHPDWTEAGVEATLANFETQPDGTVRPWLTLDRHMEILRALWEQRPDTIYGQVTTPVLIVVAEDDRDPAWLALKRRQAEKAARLLPNATLRYYSQSDHDIHVQKPAALADLLVAETPLSEESGT